MAQLSGLLLGLSLYSCRARQLVICWLFFSLLFVLLALLMLGSVFACYAGKYEKRLGGLADRLPWGPVRRNRFNRWMSMNSAIWIEQLSSLADQTLISEVKETIEMSNVHVPQVLKKSQRLHRIGIS